MSFDPETAPTFETMQESIMDRQRRHALLVGCPHCAAGSTHPCTDTKGRPVSAHVARYRAWRGRRRALAAALAVADSFGWTTTPEPNTDYRMRTHGSLVRGVANYAGVDEGRIRLLKIEVLKHAKTGGFRFWFYPLDGRDVTSDGLTANFEAVGGPWARTFEKLTR